MTARILVVDDEDGIRFSLKGILEDEGHQVFEAASGEEGLTAVETHRPDLVFLDIWLPGMDGINVLDKLHAQDASLPVVMISGHGNIETAVAAIKTGAFDFIEKPLSLEKVIIATNNALEFSRLRRENLMLRAGLVMDNVRQVTGRSPAVTALKEQIARVAPTDAWVLITGENGTGKEIVARSLHLQSKRQTSPMVAVNCAAIPEELIENELFGHEKGAFTGAESAQVGKFEMADQGTLFLDEIGDMSLKTQAKILRILQERCFERVGGRKTIRVDVRVIAATNKNLKKEIEKGAFRSDLYYRLRVFPLDVPPLRERVQDIPLLTEEFIKNMCAEHGFRPMTFSDQALASLSAYSWPGNVRELKNFVERMLILHGGAEVSLDQLPPEFGPAGTPASPRESPMLFPAGRGAVDFKAARAAFEARFLETKLREFGGSVSQLAEAVGLERSYLYRKLKAHGIQVTD